MKRVLLVSVGLFFSMNGQAFSTATVVRTLVPFTFSTNLYPVTPMKKVQSLAMELWGVIHGASLNDEMYENFMDNHDHYGQKMLTLHGLVDAVLFDLESETAESSEHLLKTSQDINYLFDLFSLMAEKYSDTVKECENNSCVVIMYVLESMVQKLGRAVETGQLNTPFYSFLNRFFYSREVTPLFPPAMMLPVAPIA